MSLYVVRHGQVPSNVKGIVSGRSNEQLTQRGIEQANEVKEKISNIHFDAIYSSDVERAKETAHIIAPNQEIFYDERLSEREPGSSLGKSRKTINKTEWNSLEKLITDDGAETLLSGIKRVSSLLEEIEENYQEKDVLIVTHMFICKAIWIIKNNIVDMNEINAFLQQNDEIKVYENKTVKSKKRSHKIYNTI